MPTRFTGRTRSGAVFGSRLSKRSGRREAAGTYAYLRGADDLVAALRRLDTGMDDEAMAQATLAGADVLAEAWRARVPVDQGDYRDSITAQASPGKVGATAAVYLGEVPGLPADQQPRMYASRLEFGSASQTKTQVSSGTTVMGRSRAAQPSLRPAYDGSVGRMVEAMEDELRDIIARNTP